MYQELWIASGKYAATASSNTQKRFPSRNVTSASLLKGFKTSKSLGGNLSISRNLYVQIPSRDPGRSLRWSKEGIDRTASEIKSSACQNRKGYTCIPRVQPLQLVDWNGGAKWGDMTWLKIVHNWKWQTEVITETLDTWFSIRTVARGTTSSVGRTSGPQEWHSESLGASQRVMVSVGPATGAVPTAPS